MTPKAKNRLIGTLSFVAGVVVTVIGFVVLTVYVSFIQPKTAQPDDEMTAEDIEAAEQAMRLEAAIDDRYHEPFNLAILGSCRTKLMSPEDISVGSWWTDGDVYFRVLTNNQDTIYMVGTNLEDRGMDITLVKHNDSIMTTDGASVFAFHDSPTLLFKTRLADGSEMQMIVSYFDNDFVCPQAVLQRYHGKGLEKQQVLP